MDDVKIINTFDKLYELLKPEFNSGLIYVVGSVLNHITGLKMKEDDSGDVDLLVNTHEGDIRLLDIAYQLSDTEEINILYEPNNKHRGVKIKYDNILIETFRKEGLSGEPIDIVYKSKTYRLYIQNKKDTLKALLNLAVVIGDRLSSSMLVNIDYPTHQIQSKIKCDSKRMVKQLSNIDMHIKNSDFDYTLMENYKTYIIVRRNFENNKG